MFFENLWYDKGSLVKIKEHLTHEFGMVKLGVGESGSLKIWIWDGGGIGRRNGLFVIGALEYAKSLTKGSSECAQIRWTACLKK